MSDQMSNESWLIDAGDGVIEKKAESGFESLNAWEKLVYALWVADYGLRNAGDLAGAEQIYPTFLSLGRESAQSLGLTASLAAFSLKGEAFEAEYFDFFEAVCDEIRQAEAPRA